MEEKRKQIKEWPIENAKLSARNSFKYINNYDKGKWNKFTYEEVGII